MLIDGFGIMRVVTEVAADAEPSRAEGNVDKAHVEANARANIAEGKRRFIC